jgi:lipoprotein-releasing system permease protein
LDVRLLIARRYLGSRRRLSLVSVISGIAAVGVALGVAALIVVLSVMNGFFSVVRDLLVSFDPHVRIEATGPAGIPDGEVASLLEVIERDIEGVEAVAPYVEGKALLVAEGRAPGDQVVVVRGVDAETYSAATGVGDAVRVGAFDLSRGEDAPGVVLGSALASRLGLYTGVTQAGGSRIELLSAEGLESALVRYPFGLPPQQRFAVRGLYELQPLYDATHVFVGLPEAQRLFRMPAHVTGVELRLADIDEADRVKAELEASLADRGGESFRIQTWYDLQRQLYDVMRLEKWGASLVLALIIVVAAFNIVGSLTMIVIEKRRDLGALRAMGARKADVRRIFLMQGLLVGGIGALSGLALGLGLCWGQARYGWVKLKQAEAFIIDAYPVEVRPFDVAVIVGVTVVLCALAALYPSARAAAVEPARAVRGES